MNGKSTKQFRQNLDQTRDSITSMKMVKKNEEEEPA